MNYTKGEWKVEVTTNFTTIEAESQTICTNVSNCDAQLIASAPDLYEALKTLRDLYTDLIEHSRTLDFWVKADKALAKAEGK